MIATNAKNLDFDWFLCIYVSFFRLTESGLK